MAEPRPKYPYLAVFADGSSMHVANWESVAHSARADGAGGLAEIRSRSGRRYFRDDRYKLPVGAPLDHPVNCQNCDRNKQ